MSAPTPAPPPPAPWKPPTRAEVNALKRRFTGLNDNLTYQEGHTIQRDYTGYKDAQRVSELAIAAYRESARVQPEPNDKTPKVGGKRFTTEGHKTLAPLAAAASTAAETHGDLRDNFNTNYKPVLEAKGPNFYENHAKPARQAHLDARKYARKQQQHETLGRAGSSGGAASTSSSQRRAGT
ncbi:hypothetical protein B0J18DRAFT_437204 [Chaetomium sp. MPI-SDFR-AT-0129]|nr:hypothetical protein B0J18DRAFT_437204 [Chaetomium sp. MPI-SDFR-AT-0129]